jgi:hypothetical protein
LKVKPKKARRICERCGNCRGDRGEVGRCGGEAVGVREEAMRGKAWKPQVWCQGGGCLRRMSGGP